MTPECGGVPGEDGWGQGGEEKSPDTQDTEGAETAPGVIMDTIRHGTEAQQRPQRDGTGIVSRGGDKDEVQEARTQAADDVGTIGAMPEHSAIHEYGTLALSESMGNLTTAGSIESGNNPKETWTEEIDTG